LLKVDVNEQNEQAVKFYEQFGFQTISSSEPDGTTGKPHPMLHMERKIKTYSILVPVLPGHTASCIIWQH
jgi:hypothetical protein